MRSIKGVTLIEMLVAMSLATLIVAASAKILVVNNRIISSQTNQSAFQSSSRLAFKAIGNDMKSATEIDNATLAINGSGNNLALSTINSQGDTQTIRYVLTNDILERRVYDDAGQLLNSSELAEDLVNDPAANPATPLFQRTSVNTVAMVMVFNNNATKKHNELRFQASFDLKSDVSLFLVNDAMPTNHLNAVFFWGPKLGYAVGDSGTILKYDNGNWANESVTSTYTLKSVKMLTWILGWAVGQNGTTQGVLVRYDRANSPPWAAVSGYFGTDARDFFAEDVDNIVVVGSTIRRYDGTTWNTETPSNPPRFNSVSQSGNTAFVVSDNDRIFRRSDSGTWNEILSHPDSPVAGRNLTSSSLVLRQNGYYLWVVGTGGTIYRYDSVADSWSIIESPSNVNLNSVHFYEENNGYIVGDGNVILRYTNNAFERLDSPAPSGTDLRGIHLYGSDSGWIVGTNGTRIRIGDFY